MAKLIITIEETSTLIEGDRTLYGFGVTQDTDLESSQHSLLPAMAPLLTEIVMRAIAIIQQDAGGRLHKVGVSDRSITLNSHMADLQAELNQPFPTELELPITTTQQN